MKTTLLATVAALALSTTPALGAPFVISSSVGGAPTGVSTDNLNWLSLGSTGGTNGALTVSFVPDAGAVQGAASGQYARPVYSNLNGALFGDNYNGPDESIYVSSGKAAWPHANAGVTLDFATDQKYLGLLWGSVDAYNTLSFYDGDMWLGSITGSQAIAVAPTGDQGVNGTYYVNIVSEKAFNRVVATSSEYAFEFDNVAYNEEAPSVPEPSSLALLGVALGAAARKLRRA